MKKLINRPDNVVREMLEGLVAMDENLALLSEHNVVIRVDAEDVRDRQVALISGGGSGHEPAHAGYVGPGMLSAAVAGEVFSSPAPDAVLAAIRAVAGDHGALLIVKNYTGDRLNFGVAAELARAGGIPVEVVVVADDVALVETQQYAGARGIAGTVFVHKIAGAAAAEGRDLQQVAAAARDAAAAVATLGIALSAGILPSSGKPTFELAEDEYELGLGIHGEPGAQRATLRFADDIANEMVDGLARLQGLRKGESIAVLLNNLGSTTNMELAIFARAALRSLEHRSLRVERFYAGTFMTSLEAAGVSLSTLRLNDDRLKLLDACTSASAWNSRGGIGRTSAQSRIVSGPVRGVAAAAQAPANEGIFHAMVRAACRSVEQAEQHLTELDRAVGDGDLGTNLARGARALEEALSTLHAEEPSEALRSLALILQKVVGGSSGALYGMFFLRAAAVLNGVDPTRPEAWADAALQACEAVAQIGDAKVGDRTMLDSLVPFATVFGEELRSGKRVQDALDAAVTAAENGASATADMLARRGRSSYIGQRVLGHPDPGAVAAAIWLRAIASQL